MWDHVNQTWIENPYDPTREFTLPNRPPFRLRLTVDALDALEAGVQMNVLQDAVASILHLGEMADQENPDVANMDLQGLVNARNDFDKISKLLVIHPRLVDHEGEEQPPESMWIRRLTLADRITLFGFLINKEAATQAITFPDPSAAGEGARVPPGPGVQAVRKQPAKRPAAA